MNFDIGVREGVKKNGKEAVRLTAWVDPPCLTASFPFFFDAFPKLHNVFF